MEKKQIKNLIPAFAGMTLASVPEAAKLSPATGAGAKLNKRKV
jgi:hypothetical protein